MTSSTVCAPALNEKHVMATKLKRKKRHTLKNCPNGAARKSTFMISPKFNYRRYYTNRWGPKPLSFITRTELGALREQASCGPAAHFFLPDLQFDVQSQHRHDYRSAVTIVAGIVDVLQSKRRVKSAPNVKCVVALHDILTPVIQSAIPE